MSEIGRLTQKLDDDVSKADVFVNGDEKAEYSAIDGAKVPSIRKFLSGMANGVKGYQTLKDLNKVTGAFEGQLSQVMNDGEASGYYMWNGSQWVKSDLDYVSWSEVYRVDGELDSVRDRYLPRSSAELDEVLLSITDSLGNRTWLEASNDNGGLTELAKNHIQTSLGFKVVNSNGQYFIAIVDESGVATDIAINKDGQFCDFVVESLRNRIKNMASMPVAIYGSSTFSEMQAHFVELLGIEGISDIFLGGDGGALIESISARIGAGSPSVLVLDGNLSPLSLSDVDSSWIVDSSMMDWNAQLSNGVMGVFSYNSINKCYSFLPSNLEADISCNGATLDVIPCSSGYNSGTVLVNAGKNNLTSSNELINSAGHVYDKTRLITKHISDEGGRFLIVGNFINTNQSNLPSAERIVESNKLLSNQYGLFYFDVAGYLSSEEIWVDVGIEPTEEDLLQQEKGELCASLSRDFQHMNSKASRAVCKKIVDHLKKIQLIKEEL